MSVCSVCGERVANVACRIIRGANGEWVCRNCLNKAGIPVMKFSAKKIPSEQIKAAIHAEERGTYEKWEFAETQAVNTEETANPQQITEKEEAPKAQPIPEKPISPAFEINTGGGFDRNCAKKNICPRCHGDNINMQAVAEGKGAGCFMVLVYIILFISVLGWLVLIPMLAGKKTQTKVYAVCQDCGHSWLIRDRKKELICALVCVAAMCMIYFILKACGAF